MSLVEYIIHDLLQEIPGITYRAMFGGYGIYKDGTMTAAIMDDTLHLKGKGELATWFEKQGCEPFIFRKKNGEETKMDYWKVPDEILENRQELETWFLKSYDQSKNSRKNNSKS